MKTGTRGLVANRFVGAVALCILTTAALHAPAAHAGVIFSDYSPTDVFSDGSRIVSGTSSSIFPGQNSPAYTFVAGSSGAVSEIDLGLEIASGTVVASLWTAAPGCGTGIYSTDCGAPLGALVPTTELGSWTVNPANTEFLSVTGISGVTLTAGNTYYLELSAGSPTSGADWYNNVQGVTGSLWQCGGSESPCPGSADIGADSQMGVFDVISPSPVPLPASAWLMLSGLGGLGAIAAKYLRRCSVA